jgi:hypothetical protein
MKSKILIVFALILFAITGCEYFENSDTLDISTIDVNITNLPALPDSMTYVGWLDSDDYAAIKIFVQDASSDGSINYQSEETLQSLQQAQEFVLTVESKSVANDSDLVPSSRELLAGRFSEATSTLTIGNGTIDFANSKAVFNLATPTNGPNTDELSGVWFVDSLSINMVAGLDLPALYKGWIYEGWIQINGQYISTGRFSNPDAADLYAGYSETIAAGYNFPGEDFLINAPAGLTFPANLSNAQVAISVEYNDGRTHGTTPFIKIFEGTIQASAQSGVSYTLQYTDPVFTGGNSIMVVDLVK